MTYHRSALGSSATYVPTPDQTFAGVDPADYDAVVSFLKKHRRTMRVHVIRMSPDALSRETLPQRKTGFDFVLDPNDTAGGGYVWSLKALRDASFANDPDRGELYYQDKTYAWSVYDVDNAAPGFDGHARVGHGSFVVPARLSAEGPSPAVIVGGLALLAGCLYLGLRSSGALRSNPPPSYYGSRPSPQEDDAAYAERALSLYEVSGRLPENLDAKRFRDGTRTLARLVRDARERGSGKLGYNLSPMQREWGMGEYRRIQGTSRRTPSAVSTEYEEVVQDIRSTGPEEGSVHPAVPVARSAWGVGSHGSWLGTPGGYWSLKRNGRRLRRSTRLDTMSFYAPVLYTGGQGLGALASYTLPTNPPTPASDVWAPPGIQYLEVDAAGNPRPEYAAITSALRIPGVGWTADDAKAGKVQLNQAKVLGPLTGDSIIKGWANAGLAVVYVASSLQAPDGFFMPIAMSNLLNNWTNQLGVYLATMPYNGPMSKAGWGPYLTPGATGTVPVKPPPGGQVTPGQVTPPGGQINPAIPQVPPGGTPGSQVIPGPGSWVPWVPGTSPIQSMSKDTYDLVVGTLLGVGLVSGLAVIGWYVLDESRRHSAPVRARARVKDYGVRSGLRDETLFSRAEPFRGEYPVVRV